MLHISLAAETIGHIGILPITNSLLATWSVMAILLVMSLAATKNLSLIPTSNWTQIMEMVVDALYDFFSQILGHHTKKVFPVVASIFLFVIIANWEGLLPGFGTIGFTEKAETTAVVEGEAVVHEAPEAATHAEEIPAHENETPAVTHGEEQVEPVAEMPHEAGASATTAESHGTKFVPLLRGSTADLNMTFAIAIIAVLSMQYFGFKFLGMHYSSRFVNFKNPIMGFIGILEIISDTSKIISFAFRLFGNIFAGEVLLAVMAFLMPFIAPMPFLFLELFVGFIQAVVFSTLTSVFINVAVSHEE
jgi:F-type H+-transporting ATPase subunit a